MLDHVAAHHLHHVPQSSRTFATHRRRVRFCLPLVPSRAGEANRRSACWEKVPRGNPKLHHLSYAEMPFAARALYHVRPFYSDCVAHGRLCEVIPLASRLNGVNRLHHG